MTTTGFTIESDSPDQTIEIGRKIGTFLEPNNIIALSGELGSGKTWLAKGMAYGLDVPNHEYVNSPAYDIVHEYMGRIKVFHIDLYRLDKLSIQDLLMIEEYYDAGGVCVIEWISRLTNYPSAFPDDFLKIQFDFDDSVAENHRKLTISAKGKMHTELENKLRAEFRIPSDE